MRGRIRIASLALFGGLTGVLSQTPVFRSTTNLQSIAVQVLDKKGDFVPGLSQGDFTLLEDGRPQKIAFFAAEKQPVSVAVLLDSSASMNYGRKLDRARELLAPLIGGHQPNDEIFFVPFTERIDAFEQLTPEQRLHSDALRLRREGSRGGTALYDALASALCHMRTAQNLRQAIVVITDGADQHSRLNLEQLIELARLSNPQIFMIGFFDRAEASIYREKKKTVTLIGEREIDNPLIVFDRLAKESGAESFFPSSEGDLKAALDRISEMLQAQYTLAYYPDNADRFRKIEVRVRHGGVRVIARHGVGSGVGADGPVRFRASTCEVSTENHPFAWEPKSSRSVLGGLVYREDFSDPRSGWPNRRERIPAPPRLTMRQPQFSSGDYEPGLRYIAGGYEISHHAPADLSSSGPIADGVVAAYGPSWEDVRASVSVQSDWPRGVVASPNHYALAAGLVVHLNPGGYYALLLTGGPAHSVQFKLAKRIFGDDGPGGQGDLLPWTPLADAGTATAMNHTISLEYKQGQISVIVDDKPAGRVRDNTFTNGLVGLGVFGNGEAVYRDLMVEELR